MSYVLDYSQQVCWEAMTKSPCSRSLFWTMSQVAKELSSYLTVMELDKLVDLHACGLEMNA